MSEGPGSYLGLKIKLKLLCYFETEFYLSRKLRFILDAM